MKKERPKVLEGRTIKVKTGCGSLYVTVNTNEGHPIELFARLGKAGGCSNSQNEALTRAISLGLRHGVPIEEYVKELKGLQCPNPLMYPEEDKALSCPDGIARVLERYVDVKKDS